jgi:hypothetical protein
MSILDTLTVTEVGRQARAAGAGPGFKMEITHVGLGSQGFNVPISQTTGLSTMTAPTNMQDKVEFSAVQEVSCTQKDISFIIEPDSEYNAHSIYLFAGDILYAVAAHPYKFLDWISPTKKNLLVIELVLEDGDPDELSFVSKELPLNLLQSREFAVLSTFQMTNALENLRQADRIRAISGDY